MIMIIEQNSSFNMQFVVFVISYLGYLIAFHGRDFKTVLYGNDLSCFEGILWYYS